MVSATRLAPTEFEIQAFLYQELQAMGLVVRGEVRLAGGRCDLVVYGAVNEPMLGIEVKRARVKHRPGGPNPDAQQVQKYRASLGCPVALVGGMGGARRLLDAITAAQKSGARFTVDVGPTRQLPYSPRFTTQDVIDTMRARKWNLQEPLGAVCERRICGCLGAIE
jgi:hypothetical protein